MPLIHVQATASAHVAETSVPAGTTALPGGSSPLLDCTRKVPSRAGGCDLQHPHSSSPGGLLRAITGHSQDPRENPRLERRSKRQGLPLFEDGPNVYESEDRLFTLLETQKQQELRLDTMIAVCAVALIAIGNFAYLAGARPSSMPNSLARLLMIGVTAACIYGVALVVYRARRKRWR